MTRLESVQHLLDEDSEVVAIDGFDDAIIGVGFKHPAGPVLVYDRAKILDILIRSGMDAESAEDFCGYNIDCAAYGDGTPIILHRGTDAGPA
jgi:hypothetical protein